MGPLNRLELRAPKPYPFPTYSHGRPFRGEPCGEWRLFSSRGGRPLCPFHFNVVAVHGSARSFTVVASTPPLPRGWCPLFCRSDVVLVEIWRQSGVWPPLRIRGSHVDYWNIQYSGAADRAAGPGQAQGEATTDCYPGKHVGRGLRPGSSTTTQNSATYQASTTGRLMFKRC